MAAILKDVRPSDYLLAALTSALGVILMVMNITASSAEDGGLAHAITNHSVAMLPVFLIATVAVLFRRRHTMAALSVAVAAMAVHVVAFDWVIRCGAGLPLAFVLAYAVGRFTSGVSLALGTVLMVALQALVLVRDSAAGMEILPVTAAIGLVCLATGWAVAKRAVDRGEIRDPLASRATA